VANSIQRSGGIGQTSTHLEGVAPQGRVVLANPPFRTKVLFFRRLVRPADYRSLGTSDLEVASAPSSAPVSVGTFVRRAMGCLTGMRSCD